MSFSSISYPKISCCQAEAEAKVYENGLHVRVSSVTGIFANVYQRLISRRRRRRWDDKKDLSSSLLRRTPKSQLTAEHPCTKKTGTYQKRYSTPKDKKRNHNEMVGRVLLQYNKILYLPGGWPANWKIIISQRFSNRNNKIPYPSGQQPENWEIIISQISPTGVSSEPMSSP